MFGCLALESIETGQERIYMKHTISRPLIALVLSGLVFTGAVFALDSGESLVSMSYVRSDYIPAVTSQADVAAQTPLESAYATAQKQIAALQADYIAQLGGQPSAGSYSSALVQTNYGQGDTLSLMAGGTFLAQSGVMKAVHNGVLIDLTTGSEVPSGTMVEPKHRYLVGEDTAVEFQVQSGTASAAHQGSYTFIASTIKTHPFTDVSSSDWYNDAVTFVYDKNLFSGMGDGTFGAGEKMDRAMAMTVFFHLAGNPQSELNEAKTSFTDVPDTQWYAPYVKWGASQSVTAGTGDGLFSPTQSVTHQQMIVLLYNFGKNYLHLELAGGADLTGMTGANEIEDWAMEAMSWAVQNNIVITNTGVLTPRSEATRAEVAAMLMNFSNVYF